MDNIDRQIERLMSPYKNVRYDACKQLEQAANLPPRAIAALEAASCNPDPAVSRAARRALLAHRQYEIQANSLADPHGQKYRPGGWVRSKQPTGYLCERCGRIIGEEILNCADRPQGRCPYLVQNLIRPKLAVVIPFSILAVVLSALLLLLFWQFGQLVLLLCGIVILPLMFIRALCQTLRTRTLLYDPVSRLKWKRTACLGITLQRTLVFGGYPLHLDLTFPRSLSFPPSVTEFAETALKKWIWRHANAVFRSALVGLLARRVVQIEVYPKYVARWQKDFKRDQNVYVLSTSEASDLNSIDGELERQIALVVRSWVKTGGDEVLEWPDGPPIYQAVRAVFKKDVPSPAGWVFELVGRDAIAQGCLGSRGSLWDLYQPSATVSEQLQTESAIINGLSAQLAQQQPDFSRVLNREIERAIRSRKERDYGPYW